MQPCPRGLVAAEPQYLLQIGGTCAVLLARDVPNGSKPQRQRFACVFENRPSSHRSLVSARTANEPPSRRRPSIGRVAPRANESFRPAQLEQVLTARIVRCEPLLQFQNRLWIALRHAPILHVVVGGVKWIALTPVHSLHRSGASLARRRYQAAPRCS